MDLYCTKRHHFGLKCTEIVGGWGSAPDPAGGAYSAPPDPLAGLGEGKGRRREGGREGEGRGRGGVGRGEGKAGRGGRGSVPPNREALPPPMHTSQPLGQRKILPSSNSGRSGSSVVPFQPTPRPYALIGARSYSRNGLLASCLK